MPDPSSTDASPLGALLTSTPPEMSDADALALAQAHFGVTGRLTRLTSERDLNFRLATTEVDYVLKLANPAEPAALTEFQTKALLHIAAHAPDLPVPRVMRTLAGDTSVALPQGRLRLLTYLQGTPMHMVPRTAALRADTARMAARLARALQGFAHPAADHVLLWDIKQSARLADLLPSIADASLRALCADWVARFSATIAPALADVPWQVVHADLNPHNVLVDPADHNRVAGVLDFGDMVRTPRVCDLAVAASYQVDFAAPLPSICAFAAAYHAELPLTRTEAGLIFDLVAMRMVTTLAITSWRAARYPENAPYILRNFALAKAGLEGGSTIDRTVAARAVLHACGMESQAMKNDGSMINSYVPGAGNVSDADAALIARRAAALGPAYRLFYESPVHLVRGEGVWLYDAAGNAYLDTYNNVASVGHCHPHVVAATARQAATFASHTRYLHDTVLDYAERLLATFPAELSHVMFTCTGSEANDLALRIARAHTGGTGFIVTETAYHGVTLAVAGMSPSLGVGVALGEHVRTVPAPDAQRMGPDVGAAFAAGVQAAIDDLLRHGIKPAGLIVDTVFSSDGVFVDPVGFLAPAVAAIRAAGGLFIADEVQPGFGRTGAAMWGFQRHGLVPDMVSLGKPMGNGYPVAGLVMQPGVIAEFGAKARYFNTFGGNAVAAATAMAVLDVIEDEGLQANARDVGAYFLSGLRDLAQSHDTMGEVRGAGLFLGVEIVRGGDPLAADAAEAARIVNALREARVLISATGPRANVLKIRPPLVFSRAHVDLFLDRLRAIL